MTTEEAILNVGLEYSIKVLKVGKLGLAIWSLKNFILCMQLANLTRKRRVFIFV